MLIERLREHRTWLGIAVLCLLTVLIWLNALSRDDEALSVTFLDVGQGDCIFLRTPSGKTMLIDGGGRGGTDYSDVIGLRVVEPFLRRNGVNKLDVVVLTHPHDDHSQGLIPVISHFRVGMVLDSAFPEPSESYKIFLSRVRAKDIPYKRAVKGQVLDFGDGVRARILHPSPERIVGTRSDANNNSIVLRVTYGKSSLLLTGDADNEAEVDLMASGQTLRSVVLKVGHHGSRSATCDAFLNEVRPRAAVISAGRGNPFGHPTPEVLYRLSRRGIKVYRTDEHGAVTIRFTRRSFSVETAVRDPRSETRSFVARLSICKYRGTRPTVCPARNQGLYTDLASNLPAAGR